MEGKKDQNRAVWPGSSFGRKSANWKMYVLKHGVESGGERERRGSRGVKEKVLSAVKPAFTRGTSLRGMGLGEKQVSGGGGERAQPTRTRPPMKNYGGVGPPGGRFKPGRGLKKTRNPACERGKPRENRFICENPIKTKKKNTKKKNKKNKKQQKKKWSFAWTSAIEKGGHGKKKTIASAR